MTTEHPYHNTADECLHNGDKWIARTEVKVYFGRGSECWASGYPEDSWEPMTRWLYREGDPPLQEPTYFGAQRHA